MANVKDLLVNGSARVIGTIYGNATSANKVNHLLTFGSKSFNGSSAQTITLADLGGKPTQSAVSSPSASGTEISFIDTISQNTNGVITATKKTVRDASASQSGVVNTGAQTFTGRKTFNNSLVSSGAASYAPLLLKEGAGNFREGLRIVPTSGWSDILLGGNDVAEESGTSANSWFLGNNNGNFYITRNGSASSTASYASVVSNYWQFYPKLGINGTNSGYNFYVNGASRFTDYLYREYTTSDQSPMIWMNGANYDNYLFQISDRASETQSYGYGLKYIGSKAGVENFLRLYADNQAGDDQIAISFNQNGQVGIKGDPDTNFSLYTNGTSRFNGDIMLSHNVNGDSPALVFNRGTTINGTDNYDDWRIYVTSGAMHIQKRTGISNGVANTWVDNLVLDNNGTSYFSDNISIKAGKEIKTVGTKATSSMIRFLDNTIDAYGNGISIGGGGVAILGAGESASSLNVAAGEETLYLLSDGEINIEANGDTIANRIGFRVSTAGHLIPVKAESGTDNTQNIGASGNRWANIYATTFHGVLDGTSANADKLDGYHRAGLYSSPGEWIKANGYTKTVTVNGDANTYYPVVITTTAEKSAINYISVWKDLGSQTASYSGNHSNGTSSMWLVYEARNWYWDGNGGYLKCWYYSMPYANLCAKTETAGNGVGSLVVYLRGGGTTYNISTTYNSTSTVYLEATNLGSSTYPVNVAPTTELGNLGKNSTTILGYGDISGNAVTASKLATARTISLTGSVTGSGTFDGSGNLSIATTTNHNHDSIYVNVTGDTMTGKLQVNAPIFGYNYSKTNNAAAFIFDKPGSHYTGIGANGTTDTIYLGACDSNGSWNTSYKQKWNFNGTVTADTFYGALSGNASSASKVNNKLTVGSKTYDGSAAVTIAASDLGLASAMLFLGTTTTAITDGATTNPVVIGSSNKTVTAGNVVLYGSKEFVWTGSAWEELGNEGSYKIVQSAVGDPSASGTSNTFIATISQDTNGKITATKKTVAVTNNAPTLSWGATSTIGTVAGTNLQVTMPANPNVDTKVTQNAITASDYTNWRPLIWGASNSGTEGFTPSTVIDGVFTAQTLSCQPATGTIRANTFKGNLSGNAAGLQYHSTLGTDDDINNFNTPNTFKAAIWNGTSSPGASNGIILSGGWNSNSYGFQIAIDDDPGWYIALRQRDGNGWKDWKRIPMGDGTGASGTWGISITGNADTLDGYHFSDLENRYVLKSGDTMSGTLKFNDSQQIFFRGKGNSDSVFCKMGFMNGVPAGIVHCVNTANHQTDGAFYITSNGYNAGNDYGGIAIDNEGVTVFGAGDPGNNFTGVFRVINEDNVAAGPVFRVQKDGNAYATKLYGAVWNDYAEYRSSPVKEPGRCIYELGDDTLALTTKRLQKGCEIISDTFGFAIGETEECKTPIAVTGRVLAYPYEDREEFKKHIGDCVCSGPGGTVSIMTPEEEKEYPSCIIGTISAVPSYEKWGSGEVDVSGRVWIRIR